MHSVNVMSVAAILRSIFSFEEKLIVVSMEVDFRYLSISNLLSFLSLVDQKAYTINSYLRRFELYNFVHSVYV